MKIHTKKEVIDGKKGRRIVDFEGILSEQ